MLISAAEPPSAQIANEKVRATLYLPDAANGYYRGTRFDWGGVIASLECGGHSYFGVWFDKYDPKLHDAITGPVEEFFNSEGALGYREAPVGGTFIRIGVGTLRKPQEAAFQRFFTYDIVDPGKWKVSKKKDAVTFEHLLQDASSGYAYRYVKTVRLIPGKPELLIEHTLKNTGKKKIETDVYNHNFMVMDGQPTGPDFAIGFNFEPKASRDMGGLAAISGKELTYPRQFAAGETVVAELAGFGPTSVSDHEFRVVNRKTGAAVRITGDKPLSKIVFWSAHRVLSPENYVTLSLDPGQESKWTIQYEFSSVPKQ
jgi:hypothetical protein